MNENMLFHLKFDANAIKGEYAILPGDPDRAEAIADHFPRAQHIHRNREYNIYRGETPSAAGTTGVFICSTGIGGPSAAIAVEELYLAGVRTFIRVGTCGAMQVGLQGGDLVIASAAARQEGTSLHYAPVEYPAVADYDVTAALIKSAKQGGYHFHTGVVQSKDSFYGQHEPERMPVKDELLSKWRAFKSLGVLASEMECAAIYTAAAALGAKAGCVLHVIWNQERAAAGLCNPKVESTKKAVRCAADAVKMLALSAFDDH